MSVRPAAVAGLFYPNSPMRLAEQVDTLLAHARDPGAAPKAMIVPHAGYQYSGAIAALGYACLFAAQPPIKQVVLLGPCHRVACPGLGLPGVDALATPLGDVEVWVEGVAAVTGLPLVETLPEVHAQEHSLEVHLPFIQRTLPDAKVLPLAVGSAGPEVVAAVLDEVWGGPETLVVVSSDLSHYHRYERAQRFDQMTIDRILRLDPTLPPELACGARPVNGLLLAAQRHDLQATLVGAANSGDTAGDKRQVVGYACVRFDPLNLELPDFDPLTAGVAHA
ncbi:MAG: AmmeMemoRadiSam system protein B [Micrococcales bacterium]|nr:AmmeMemoRadiSam system protein B [Micrococcales bacterium]